MLCPAYDLFFGDKVLLWVGTLVLSKLLQQESKYDCDSTFR